MHSSNPVTAKEDLFQEVFLNSPAAQCIVLNDGTIEQPNKAFTQFFEKKEMEMKGKQLWGQFLSNPSEMDTKYIRELEADESRTMLLTCLQGEYKNVAVEFTVTPYDQHHYCVMMWPGITHRYAADVEDKLTDLSLREAELLLSNQELTSRNYQLNHVSEELKKRNYELDQFVYKASHDMRSPIVTVLGLINLMRDMDDLITIKGYLDLITNKMEGLDSLLQTILDIARHQKQELTITSINLHEFIDKIVNNFESHVNFSRLKINRDIPEAETIKCDVSLLSIVASNLIGNAIKYQNLSHDNSFLTINFHKTKYNVCISFADNGIGMMPKTVEHVFDMFYRGTNIATGSGLGMYIVKQCVDRLKGKITVDSIYGKGTTIHLTLPRYYSKPE